LREARDTMELLKTAELQDFFEDECVAAKKKRVPVTLDRTPPHTALLYPISMPDKLAILLALPDEMRHVTVPVDAKTLKKVILRFRRRLQTRLNNRFLSDAKQIYDWLIRPVLSALAEHEIDTLIIAPDGALRLVPFTTLHDGERFLVEDYAMAIIPAITLTDFSSFEQENAEILLSGLSEGGEHFSALPGVVDELRDIREIMNGKTVLHNEDYTVANLTKEFKERAYSIVHIATHGIFGGTPEETFLLAYHENLTMNRLERLIGMSRRHERQVELLTLSACQTALGNERAALGLAGSAVKAGVGSVIATLWYVDDEATSLTVREFYRQLRRPGMSKAKALQNAQKKLIIQPRYWQPLYWAPFILIGNWN
ncbi:CHAT domain-containing protein, partial [Desulfobacterales bacterium HSG2]|nr:CHAT domain-containing protein [Desulfobacterales bacterium HSG2]